MLMRALCRAIVFCLLAAPVAASTTRVRVVAEKVPGSASFVAHNDTACPVVITVDISSVSNATARAGRLAAQVVGPHSTRVLARIQRANPRLAWSYYWKYAFVFGQPVPSPAPYLYRFPFDPSHPRRLSQGNGGTFTHYGPEQYAFDFAMPEGTLVVAARAGRVGYVVDEFSQGGTTAYFKDKANEVLIVHSDGTLGRYAHIRHHGALVREGQEVAAGTPLAYSGSTGFSSLPHLHFDVRVAPLHAEGHTVPLRFADGTRTGLLPTQGRDWPGGGRAQVIAAARRR